MPKMLKEVNWEKFQRDGMIWFVNRMLHIVGYAIVMEIGDDKKIKRVYPARTRFRGFSADVEEKGFRKVSRYIKKNIMTLLKEAES